MPQLAAKARVTEPEVSVHARSGFPVATCTHRCPFRGNRWIKPPGKPAKPIYVSTKTTVKKDTYVPEQSKNGCGSKLNERGWQSAGFGPCLSNSQGKASWKCPVFW